jgi:hypothetical protein
LHSSRTHVGGALDGITGPEYDLATVDDARQSRWRQVRLGRTLRVNYARRSREIDQEKKEQKPHRIVLPSHLVSSSPDGARGILVPGTVAQPYVEQQWSRMNGTVERTASRLR